MSIAIPSVKLGAIAPELILIATACTVLMVDVFSKVSGRDRIAYLSLAGVLLAGWYAICPLDHSYFAFSGLYSVDKFTQFFKLIFLLGTGMTILVSVRYVEENNLSAGEYYSILLFATVGMMFIAGGADLITIFMGIELMSVCLYVLAGYTRTRKQSNEAAVKYFLLGAFASGFLLYGMALTYGLTGQTQLVRIAGAISSDPQNITILTVAVGLMMVGFAFKTAAVPFHQWTPDVYTGAPIPITAFMSAGPKAAAMAAILRVFVEAVNFLQVDWIMWISVLAIMTMTVGNIAALMQNDIKRMLAFSSISHAGYAMVGISAVNAGGISSVMYYMLVYTFMNIGAFGILALVARKNEQDTSIKAFRGLAYTNPVLAIVMTVLVFSLAGIPPMAGFLSKFYLFMAAVNAGHVGLVIVAVINSAIGVYYYLKIVVAMYMREKEEAEQNLPPIRVPAAMVVLLVVSLYGVFKLGVDPSGYLEMANKALLSF